MPFVVCCQDYTLVKDENGPGDVKQRAVGPVYRFLKRFATRAEARRFLAERRRTIREEGYQCEVWIESRG